MKSGLLVIVAVLVVAPVAVFLLYITGLFGGRRTADTTAVAVSDISPKVEAGQNVADNAAVPQTPFCKPENIRAIVALGGTAANVYGNATLQNTSNQICSVLGNKYIVVQYDTQFKNISSKNSGKFVTDLYQLTPNQMLYSSFEYPNSPNCREINETELTFSYQISDVDTVIFTDEEGHNAFKVRTCEDLSNDIEIGIVPFTDKPSAR